MMMVAGHECCPWCDDDASDATTLDYDSDVEVSLGTGTLAIDNCTFRPAAHAEHTRSLAVSQSETVVAHPPGAINALVLYVSLRNNVSNDGIRADWRLTLDAHGCTLPMSFFFSVVPSGNSINVLGGRWSTGIVVRCSRSRSMWSMALFAQSTIWVNGVRAPALRWVSVNPHRTREVVCDDGRLPWLIRVARRPWSVRSDAATDAAVPCSSAAVQTEHSACNEPEPKVRLTAKRPKTKIIEVKNSSRPAKKLRCDDTPHKNEACAPQLFSLCTPSRVMRCTPPSIVVVTSGIRLSSDDVTKAEQLGIVFAKQPHLWLHCTAVVADPPLKRSIKLLVALCNTRYLFSPRWLDSCLRLASLRLPVNTEQLDQVSFRDTATRNSLESQNKCNLKRLVAVNPERRRSLFAGLTFFVDPSVVPQDAVSGNDVKALIQAAGGTLRNDSTDVDIVVVPKGRTMSSPKYRSDSTRKAAPKQSLVTTEDIYRSILQHKQLCGLIK